MKEVWKLIADEIAELVTRYQAGASMRFLATEFNIHEGTDRVHLRSQGIPLRPTRVLTGRQDDEAERLYVDQVWTMAEIATKFDVSESAIRKVLLRREIRARPQVRRGIPRRARSQRG